MRLLPGLSSIADRYDGFLIDLWGVVHDGVAPYPPALDVLRRLRGRRVLLLSNAPRRARSVQLTLRGMGVEDALYSGILTSGEATWLALQERQDPWFSRLGRKAYHLGPERDRPLLDGLDLERVSQPADADFVVNTGPDDLRDASPLEVFIPELDACRGAGLPMICANPDLTVLRQGQPILCAGSLATYYRSIGGDVRSVGKPDLAIYAQALGLLELDAPSVLAIGDSLHTDIAGAASAGIDSLWIMNGIHKDITAGGADQASALAARFGLAPSAAMMHLAW